jgi:hypothetical protein
MKCEALFCALPEVIMNGLRAVKEDEALHQFLADRGVLTGAYANLLTALDPSWTMAESNDHKQLAQIWT